MARVAQELQLVSMKAVAHVGKQMQQRNGGRDRHQNREIDAATGARIVLSP
jgi:hypothetical protein